MKRWKLCVVALVLLWLVVVLYMTSSAPGGDGVAEVERLHQQNLELQNVMAQYRNETEHSRRKAEKTASELWRFLKAQMQKMANITSGEKLRFAKLRRDLEGYRRTMEDDFVKLRRANLADDWRDRKSRVLGSLVQRRLRYLQNPTDCSKTKKVLCGLTKECGFGCQLHHVTYCLITAYALGRTLVLESRRWKYTPGGWEEVFKPLSDTCRTIGNDNKTQWGFGGAPSTKTNAAFMSLLENVNVVKMPDIGSLQPRPDFLPLAIPADLAPELTTFHGDPPVWWIGQMVRYLFRPNTITENWIKSSSNRLGFQNTIVGVHVRRTDKLNDEAQFHGIDEYMAHVADYYDILQRTRNVPRRVYLATDDTHVLSEAREKYPQYTFISDVNISKSAGLGTRYSGDSLRGVILDIYLLSRCDFLVCTFSSQVCRVAYEIMQTLHGDASQSFRSLDDVYYYGGQDGHVVRVLEDHPADGDGFIDIRVGDVVDLHGNHWDGFSKGRNRRTQTTGLFPSYKVESPLVTVNMPTYPEVPTYPDDIP